MFAVHKGTEVEVAKTTQYQNNGGLNALVHVLYENMDAVAGTRGAGRLPSVFKVEHGYDITLGQLKALLKDLTPVQREVVLGPVLRRMAVTHAKRIKERGAWGDLSADDVRGVANQFEIKVEAYSTDEETKRLLEKGIREQEEARIELAKTAEIEAQYSIGGPAFNFVAARAARLAGTAIIAENAKLEALEKDLKIRVEREIKQLVDAGMHLHSEAKKAHKPGLDVVGYHHRTPNQVAFTKATLQLWFEGNQWGRVVTTSDIADTHNESYKAGRKFYDYDTEHAMVTAQLLDAKIEYEKAVAAGKPNPKINVASLFAKSEEKSGKSATQEQNMQTMIEKLMGTFTDFMPGGKDSIFGMLTQFLVKIIGGIFSMVPLLKEMGKQFKQGHQSQGSEIDAEEIAEISEKDPELGLAYEKFAKLSSQIDDPALNKAWRANPNSPEVWQQAFSSLVDAGRLDEADEWLKGAERRLIQELRAMERRNPTGAQGQQLLNIYIKLVQDLENPVLAYSKPEEKTRNLMERFTMYTTVSTRMRDVLVAHEKAEKLAQVHVKEEADLAELRRLPVCAALNTRLGVVQAAWNQTDAELRATRIVVGRKDAVAATLGDGTAQSLTGMFNAYKPEFEPTLAAATAEKARLDRVQKEKEAREMKLAELYAKAGGRRGVV